MLPTHNNIDFKIANKNLKNELAKMGFEIANQSCLNLLARTLGYTNYNTIKPELEHLYVDDDCSMVDYTLISTQDKILSILDKLPVLTVHNVRVFKNKATIQDHQYLFDHFNEFEKACEWLKNIEKINSFNHSSTSYGIKHIAERAIKTYISNETIIAAAVYSGFNIKLIEDSPNVLFNMSKKSLKQFL